MGADKVRILVSIADIKTISQYEGHREKAVGHILSYNSIELHRLPKDYEQPAIR